MACLKEVEEELEKAVEEARKKMGKEKARKSFYLGETSRSGRERVKEHLWLFTHRKEACLDNCSKRHKHSSTNSALWHHSKEVHGGNLRVED